MAKHKCKLVRVCADEVVIKRAHLREDIREAKAGIRKDEHELGLRGLSGSPEQHSAAIMRSAEGVYDYTKAVSAYEAHGDCTKAVLYGFDLSRNVGIYENEVKWAGERPDSALVLGAENTLAAVVRKCSPRKANGLSGEVVAGRSPVDTVLDTARMYDSMARASLRFARQLRAAGDWRKAEAELKVYERLKKAAEEELEDAMLLESGASIDTIEARKRAYRIANGL